MKNLLLCAVALLGFSLTACKYSTEYTAVNAENAFSVSLPPWMKKQDDLKPGAVLQYANRFRNFYMVGEALPAVTEDKLVEAIQRDSRIVKNALKNAVVSDSTATEANGMKGVRMEIYGKMNNENIYFTEVWLSGTKHLYHISIWTRGEDRKLRYKADTEKILQSVKEI